MIVKSCERLNFRCPTCKSLMNSWTLPRIHDPAGPFLIDGDTIPGMSQRVGWTGKEPWHFALELTRPCSQCRHSGIMISIYVMSVKYMWEVPEKSRLLFNSESGEEEFFECFSPVGKWKMIEYKSAQLPPMQWHLIGPLPISDGQSLKSPWGFTACSYSQDFQHATQKILREWDVIKELAEVRQCLWEHSILKQNEGNIE